MHGNTVINDDWKDYDKRKLRERSGNQVFRCDHEWEVNYLHSKIRKLYPAIAPNAIHEAIKTCCVSMPLPLLREMFVQYVMQQLLKNRDVV